MKTEDIRLLTEVGFLAAARGDVQRASVIFRALERLRPQAGFPCIGLAVALLNAGKPADAVLELDSGLLRVPASDAAELHAFRGLALQKAGRQSESLRAFRQAGDHPMALAMLGETQPA